MEEYNENLEMPEFKDESIEDIVFGYCSNNASINFTASIAYQVKLKEIQEQFNIK